MPIRLSAAILLLGLMNYTLAHASGSIDKSIDSTCINTPTPSCLLTVSLQQLSTDKVSTDSITDKATAIKTSDIKSRRGNEDLLLELAYESYFLNEQEIFQSAIKQIKKNNTALGKSLQHALENFPRNINPNKEISTIGPIKAFPTKKTRELAKEDFILQLIKQKHPLITQTFDNPEIIFSDSLRWSASNYYYLTLVREVEIKKSLDLKRKLIYRLAQSPSDLHDKKNLDIALMETLGGALKQGEETRLKSNINAFSEHQLTHTNKRIVFFKNFLRFYNNNFSLQKKQCDNPKLSIANAIDTFFLPENRALIEQLDRLTLKNPNNHLLAGMVLTHINECSPLSDFFLQRYLQEISTIKSIQETISHLRSFRRYSNK